MPKKKKKDKKKKKLLKEKEWLEKSQKSKKKKEKKKNNSNDSHSDSFLHEDFIFSEKEMMLEDDKFFLEDNEEVLEHNHEERLSKEADNTYTSTHTDDENGNDDTNHWPYNAEIEVTESDDDAVITELQELNIIKLFFDKFKENDDRMNRMEDKLDQLLNRLESSINLLEGISEEEAPGKQCTGVARDGKRCKRLTKDSTGRCPVHKGQPETIYDREEMEKQTGN